MWKVRCSLGKNLRQLCTRWNGLRWFSVISRIPSSATGNAPARNTRNEHREPDPRFFREREIRRAIRLHRGEEAKLPWLHRAHARALVRKAKNTRSRQFAIKLGSSRTRGKCEGSARRPARLYPAALGSLRRLVSTDARTYIPSGPARFYELLIPTAAITPVCNRRA